MSISNQYCVIFAWVDTQYLRQLRPVTRVLSAEAIMHSSLLVLTTVTHCCSASVTRTQFGRRAFSVAGTVAWNALPDSIRDTLCQPAVSDFI